MGQQRASVAPYDDGKYYGTVVLVPQSDGEPAHIVVWGVARRHEPSVRERAHYGPTSGTDGNGMSEQDWEDVMSSSHYEDQGDYEFALWLVNAINTHGHAPHVIEGSE